MKATNKSKSVNQFSRKQIYQIAKFYSLGSYTHLNFSKEFGCSQHTFYSILHKAVSNCIISDSMANKVIEVAVSSSQKKLKEIGVPESSQISTCNRIRNSWEKLMQKRKTFCFSKVEAIKLVKAYTYNKLSKAQFCKANYVSPILFDSTFKKVIISGWISDEDLNKLQAKSEYFHGAFVTNPFFNALRCKRNEYKCQKKKQ